MRISKLCNPPFLQKHSRCNFFFKTSSTTRPFTNEHLNPEAVVNKKDG